MAMDTGSVMSADKYLKALTGVEPEPDASRLSLRFLVDGSEVEVSVECDRDLEARFRQWLERCSQRYGWNGQVVASDVYRVGGAGHGVSGG